MKKFTAFIVLLFAVFIAAQTKLDLLYDDLQITKIYITIDPVHLNFILNNPHSDYEFPCTVNYINRVINETIDSVGFRIRGNTSRDAQKKSFKLDFNKYFPGRTFYSVTEMNLNGEHNDPSIVRSKLGWNFFQKMGMKSSRANHVELYLNNKFYGVYISVEHVDKFFLKNHFVNNDGNLWKCLWPADLVYLGEDPNLYKSTNGGTTYDLITNEVPGDYTNFARFVRVVNNTPQTAMLDSLRKLLDLKSFLKYFTTNVLFGAWDDYWFLKNNYYIYHEPVKDKIILIPYDYDNSMGVDWFGVDWSQRSPYMFGNSNEPRPLTRNLFNYLSITNLYTHFLDFYSQLFKLNNWEPEIDFYRNQIVLPAQRDTFRTKDYGFTIDDFYNSYSANHYSNQHVKFGLKEFANRRYTSVRNQIFYSNANPIVYDYDYYPKSPRPIDTIHFNVSLFSRAKLTKALIQIKYSNDHWVEYPLTFNPIPDTKLIEEADRWSVNIPPIGRNNVIGFRFYLLDSLNQSDSYPRNLVTITSTDTINNVVINEVLAKNTSIIQDDAGQFEDWIEVYNPTTQSIDLSNYYLTDNPLNLNKWQFPSGTILSPFEHKIIWCDEDSSQGPMHANFKIAIEGEFIALINGTSFIDSITIPAQTVDISYGRIPSGSYIFGFMPPTPNAANSPLNVEDENEVITNYSLSTYPNPFNSTLTVEYTISSPSEVNFSVYNLLGEKIKEFNVGNVREGKYNFKWNTEAESLTIPSGIYFIKMDYNNRSLFKKIVLMK
ncbi:MAG TPA: CotH kinase family protein [Ignavibacteriaceae bacterium]|nr:CotH kinase family protein [Ignavibacteriaceae bacterium]